MGCLWSSPNANKYDDKQQYPNQQQNHDHYGSVQGAEKNGYKVQTHQPSYEQQQSFHEELQHDYEEPTADPIHSGAQGPTKAISIYSETVLSEKQGDASKFRVMKELGKGGFGVVSLCERTGPPDPRIPNRFALKELISPKVFPLGQKENIRDYLPLNEAAIQRYMRHSSIVDTYWADVRCLHPDTNQPLNVGLNDLEGAWTPLDNLSDFEKTYTEAAQQQRPSSGGAQLPFKAVKLQMRIAMEHCDLGSIKDYLVDNPERQGTRTLVEMLRLKRRMNITVDPTLCALLTSLDIAEALKFMHKSKTLHGDLKPHNILLVSAPQGDDKGFRAKISDFGLSQHMTKDQHYVLVSKGTEAYLPMEVFKNLALTEKSDVYALGLLMWEIFYGIFWHAIYEKEKQRRQVRRPIEMGDYHPSCNGFCPEGFANVVHACVRRDPASRPTAADIVTGLNGVIASLGQAQQAAAAAAPPLPTRSSMYGQRDESVRRGSAHGGGGPR